MTDVRGGQRPTAIYIASRLENAEQVRQLRDAFGRRGIGLTYDWTEHGAAQDQGEARMAEVAGAEARGVAEADLVVILLPGGRGTHVELGLAIGAGRPVIVMALAGSAEPPCAFYHHPKVLLKHNQAFDAEFYAVRILAHRSLAAWLARESQPDLPAWLLEPCDLPGWPRLPAQIAEDLRALTSEELQTTWRLARIANGWTAFDEEGEEVHEDEDKYEDDHGGPWFERASSFQCQAVGLDRAVFNCRRGRDRWHIGVQDTGQHEAVTGAYRLHATECPLDVDPLPVAEELAIKVGWRLPWRVGQ